MNRNTVIGLALIAAATICACHFAVSPEGTATGLFGKAVWYLPYAAMVGGVQRIIRSRG